MGKLDRHWTEASLEAYLHRIATDWVVQIEKAMEKEGVKQSEIARALSVSKGRVSQVLNDPGNLTLKKIIEYTRTMGKKVAVVCYDDDDPENQNGPINSEIFELCWQKAGRPSDFFQMEESPQVAGNTDVMIKVGDEYRYGTSRSANIKSWQDLLLRVHEMASNDSIYPSEDYRWPNQHS